VKENFPWAPFFQKNYTAQTIEKTKAAQWIFFHKIIHNVEQISRDVYRATVVISWRASIN